MKYRICIEDIVHSDNRHFVLTNGTYLEIDRLMYNQMYGENRLTLDVFGTTVFIEPFNNVNIRLEIDSLLPVNYDLNKAFLLIEEIEKEVTWSIELE